MIEILYKVPIRAPVAATFRTRYPGLKPPAGRDRVLAIRGARGRAPSPPPGHRTIGLRLPIRARGAGLCLY
jgi:hypothetical protein